MPSTEMSSHLPDRIMGPRRIAVVLADLADPAVDATVDKLGRVVDEVVLLDHRQGVAAAYHEAFADLCRRLDGGDLSPDDLVVTLAADHGHDVGILDDLQRLVVRERLDALLVRRDLSGYAWSRRLAHVVLSGWATLWGGRVRLHDVASCDRVFRLAALADALDHCGDGGTVGTVDLAVALSRLGCRVRNDVLVAMPLRPPQRGAAGGLADAVTLPGAAFRVEDRRHTPAEAVANLAWPLAATAGILFASLWLARQAWTAVRRAVAR